MDLEVREQQIRNLEQKLCSVEEAIDDMQKHINEYKKKAQNASDEVSFYYICWIILGLKNKMLLLISQYTNVLELFNF